MKIIVSLIFVLTGAAFAIAKPQVHLTIDFSHSFASETREGTASVTLTPKHEAQVFVTRATSDATKKTSLETKLSVIADVVDDVIEITTHYRVLENNVVIYESTPFVRTRTNEPAEINVTGADEKFSLRLNPSVVMP